MSENEKEESKRPLESGFFSLGIGKGVKFTLWDNNVTLQRQEKQDDKWQTTEEFHLASSILKEFSWRVPHWLKVIEEKRQENKE